MNAVLFFLLGFISVDVFTCACVLRGILKYIRKSHKQIDCIGLVLSSDYCAKLQQLSEELVLPPEDVLYCLIDSVDVEKTKAVIQRRKTTATRSRDEDHT